MKIKKCSMIICLIVSSSIATAFQFGYMDSIKGTQKVYHTAKFFCCSAGLSPVLSIGLLGKGVYQANSLRKVAPLLHFARTSTENANLEKTIAENNAQLYRSQKYNTWYSNSCASTPIGLAESYFIYPWADTTAENAMQKLNDFEYVKKIRHSISEENSEFIADNSKLIVSVALSRSISFIADSFCEVREIPTANRVVKQFGKDVAMQVACHTAEEYVVKPMIESMVGKEESFSKDVLSVGLNGVMFYGISSIVAKN